MKGALWCAVLGFVLGSPARFAQDSNPTVEVLEAEAAEHRVGTRGPIYANLNVGEEDVAVTLDLVVGTDGRHCTQKKRPDSLAT